MMRRQFVLPLAVLFIAFGVPSIAQNAEEEGVETVAVSVAEGAPLVLECELLVTERVEWRRDGAAPPADLRAAGERAAPRRPARLAARLAAPAARARHAGAYTCARRPTQRVLLTVRAAPGEAPASPAPSPAPAPDASGVLFYEVGRPFAVNCSVAAAPGVKPVWKVNDTALASLDNLRGRYMLEKDDTVLKMIGRTSEDDFGNYTCSSGGAEETWEVRGRPHAKLQHNTNVVEKEKLKLTCKLTGKPYPAVTWSFRNDTENGTDALEALGERAHVQASAQGVAGAELVLGAAARADAGVYTCAPAGGLAASTTLRVKDQYAALWPFLGICAEVFVLCAVILVYEKRRTKPELDDSDTDNHEQKKS